MAPGTHPWPALPQHPPCYPGDRQCCLTTNVETQGTSCTPISHLVAAHLCTHGALPSQHPPSGPGAKRCL